MEDAHAKTTEEVLKFFGTNDEVGLSADQVKQYQAKYGPNGECRPATIEVTSNHSTFRLVRLRHHRRFIVALLWFNLRVRCLHLTACWLLRTAEQEKKLLLCLIYDYASRWNVNKPRSVRSCLINATETWGLYQTRGEESQLAHVFVQITFLSAAW